MVNANNPDGYSSDTTNLVSKDGEKDKDYNTLKTNLANKMYSVSCVQYSESCV